MMKLEKSKKHGPLALVMDELAARVDQGFRRPMNLILGTIDAIRAMDFAPEVEAATAQEFREGMQALMKRLPSDDEIAELSRNLLALKEAFAKTAIR